MNIPDIPSVYLAILYAFLLGAVLGRWAEARLWRGKGDHDYMNRMASGGALYIVKREVITVSQPSAKKE